MQDIKIGDIVQPTTPYKVRDWGIGAILDVGQNKRYPITVIFPMGTSFQVHEFSFFKVKKIDVDQEKRKQILGILRDYRQMQRELSRS